MSPVVVTLPLEKGAEGWKEKITPGASWKKKTVGRPGLREDKV